MVEERVENPMQRMERMRMTRNYSLLKLGQMKILAKRGPLRPKKQGIDRSSQTYTVYIEFSYLNSTQLFHSTQLEALHYLLGIRLQIWRSHFEQTHNIYPIGIGSEEGCGSNR
jgi:hypothetical protein